MRTRWFLLAALGAATCFALGALWAGRFGVASPSAAQPMIDAGAPAVFAIDAGAGPRVMIDPETIQLLPDASLRLDLPAGFDAGR